MLARRKVEIDKLDWIEQINLMCVCYSKYLLLGHKLGYTTHISSLSSKDYRKYLEYKYCYEYLEKKLRKGI